MSIDEVISNVSKFDVARPNRYHILFQLPTILPIRGIERRLNINCTSVEMPGTNIPTQPQANQAEIPRPIPYTRGYTNILNMSFRLSIDYMERQLFQNWLDAVVDNQGHTVGYLNEFKGSVLITQLDRQDHGKNNELEGGVYSIRVNDIFPKEISALAFGHDKRNVIHEQAIQFSYFNWEVITTTFAQDRPQDPNGLTDFFNQEGVSFIQRAVGGKSVPVATSLPLDKFKTVLNNITNFTF